MIMSCNKKKIIFATKNENKYAKIKRLLKDLNYEILSLADMPEKIIEPKETGFSPKEIAEEKARYYWAKLGKSIAVLTQDDVLDFCGNVSKEDNSGLSIKSPVIRRYGKFNDTTAIKFYSSLAKKYGGEIDILFRYGHAYIDKAGIKSKESVVRAKLVSKPRGVEKVGNYPLRAITKVKVGNNYIYSTETSAKDRLEVDSGILKSLLEILK